MSKYSSIKLQSLVTLAASACYNEERKQQFKTKALGYLREVAKLLELSPGTFDVRFNAGGIAGSGNAVLHTDRAYVHINDFGCYWRTCRGRKDYTGDYNRTAHDSWTPTEFSEYIRVATAPKPDFSVFGSGSVYLLTPISPACKEWCDAHVGDDETQYLGDGIAVEHRYIQPLVEGLQADGFVGTGL